MNIPFGKELNLEDGGVVKLADGLFAGALQGLDGWSIEVTVGGAIVGVLTLRAPKK